MNEPPKFLFDECLGRPITEVLRRFVGLHRHQVGIIHLLDKFPAGTHDDVWIPVIAKEGWIIVSADRGKSSGPKLPSVCAKLGVRHILYSPRAASLPQFEKARAFLRVWRDAVNLWEANPGTRADLKFNAAGPVLDPRPGPPAQPVPGLTVEW